VARRAASHGLQLAGSVRRSSHTLALPSTFQTGWLLCSLQGTWAYHSRVLFQKGMCAQIGGGASGRPALLQCMARIRRICFSACRCWVGLLLWRWYWLWSFLAVFAVKTVLTWELLACWWIRWHHFGHRIGPEFGSVQGGFSTASSALCFQTRSKLSPSSVARFLSACSVSWVFASSTGAVTPDRLCSIPWVWTCGQ